jgi:uncharacterized protein with HEPN domain
MTLRDDKSRLNHILDAAHKAVQYTALKKRGDLDTDEILSLAIIRLLEIIGEATNGISEELREQYPSVAWTEMVAMRNKLIHAYFEVDNRLVWETLTRELPPLILQIEQILKEKFN